MNTAAAGEMLEPALSGYDVVSYFTKGRAEKGRPEFTYQHKGATYRFSDAKQRDMFAANPDKYLPQYDGFCAYGVIRGRKLQASPEAWKIVDGKLYLNLNKELLAEWSKDTSKSIRQGDAQWQKIKDSPPR
jgi:YHS domain-containing protein